MVLCLLSACRACRGRLGWRPCGPLQSASWASSTGFKKGALFRSCFCLSSLDHTPIWLLLLSKLVMLHILWCSASFEATAIHPRRRDWHLGRGKSRQSCVIDHWLMWSYGTSTLQAVLLDFVVAATHMVAWPVVPMQHPCQVSLSPARD